MSRYYVRSIVTSAARRPKTFDQDLFNDGLTVSVVGMGVVFVVLASLAVSIKVISLLDRDEQPSVATPAPVPAAAPASSSDGISGEQVAAIAVAIALSESPTRSIPARTSEKSSAGSWLQAGRSRVLNNSGNSAYRERRG